MYETQDNIPIRDWMTLGGVLLILIVVVVLTVTIAENTSSSIQVVNGQVVTAQGADQAQGKDGNGQGQGGEGDQQGGGVVVAANDKKSVNQMSFIEVFLLLVFGAAVFTVVISILIALLIIQGTRIFKQLRRKSITGPPGQKG